MKIYVCMRWGWWIHWFCFQCDRNLIIEVMPSINRSQKIALKRDLISYSNMYFNYILKWRAWQFIKQLYSFQQDKVTLINKRKHIQSIAIRYFQNNFQIDCWMTKSYKKIITQNTHLVRIVKILSLKVCIQNLYFIKHTLISGLIVLFYNDSIQKAVQKIDPIKYK